MKTRIAAVATAIALGAASVSSAMAYDPRAAGARWTGFETRQPVPLAAPGLGVHDNPYYEACPMSSAAEGNANQQTRPVKQYGQVAGGGRC